MYMYYGTFPNPNQPCQTPGPGAGAQVRVQVPRCRSDEFHAAGCKIVWLRGGQLSRFQIPDIRLAAGIELPVPRWAPIIHKCWKELLSGDHHRRAQYLSGLRGLLTSLCLTILYYPYTG